MVARLNSSFFLLPFIIIFIAPLRVKRSINLFYSSSRFLLYILHMYRSSVGEKKTLQDSMHRIITPDHKTVHRPAS